MPSIVDPATARNGAGTVTSNLIRMMEAPPIGAQVECIPVRVPSSRRLRKAFCIGRSLVASIPAKPGFTYSRELRQRLLARLQQTDFDLIAFNGSDLLWMLPWLPAAMPRILILHNLEHQLFSSQAALVERKFPLLAPLLRREQEKLQTWEEEGIRSVGNVLFLSQCDAEYAPPINGGIVVPPVFVRPPAPRTPLNGSPLLNIGFLGNMTWWPNREGLLWFLTQVFPHVRTRIRLHLFGVDTERFAGVDPQIVKHGSVADLQEVWRSCDLMICPIFHGGGVCAKLAEALYNGVPVLTTKFATRGLPVESDSGLTILDGSQDWCTFLTSELCTRQVSPHLSERFAATGHVAALHEFLRRFQR